MGAILPWAVALAICAVASLPAAREPAGRSLADRSPVAIRPPAGIAGLRALEEKVRRTVAQVSPSVVSVSGGSGVVISSDGYVLTVAHVARRAGRSVVVVFPDGRHARAVTLGNDHGVDAGMVKITDRGPWPFAPMGRSGDLQPGQWCLTLGYPVSFPHAAPPLVRIGRVLRSEKHEIITDCTIMGGDSGAPLFDLDGNVIAIGTMCDTSLVHNIHVPIGRYADGWTQLLAGEDFNSLAPKQALLGVFASEETGDARIGRIVPGSGAEKAGLRPGDVLVKFGGTQISKYEELPPLVQKRKPGDQVEVELRRGTESLRFRVTLGGSNPGAAP